MRQYDIAVVGGGPAGVMAAIRAAELNKKVILIERNNSIGKKLTLTGKGRCNITNAASIEVFIEKFGRQGEFFRTAFFAFFNQDLIDFFKSNGLELKEERQARVFPITDSAKSVVEVLKKCLLENKVEVLYDTRLAGIKVTDGYFRLETEVEKDIAAARVILATGGASYKETGSSGDGFNIAKRLGHRITAIRGGLVPLKTKEPWVKGLQGLALENIRLAFGYGKKKIVSEIGELMFTHFGVSGPLVLDLSGEIVSLLETHEEISLGIDLKPGLRKEQLESKFVHKFAVKGNVQMKNLMQDVLPKRLIALFLSLLKIAPEKRTSQITKTERGAIIDMLKNFPLTITGALPVEEAMVTAGGVSTKDINHRTMESRLVKGLYFAGEIIDGAGPSGGYNLQQAFSTGYLAGEKAAYA